MKRLTYRNIFFVLYSWESPQGAVLTAEGRVTAVDGQLSITGAQTQDSGNYTCVVANVAARRTIKVLITVSGMYSI